MEEGSTTAELRYINKELRLCSNDVGEIESDKVGKYLYVRYGKDRSVFSNDCVEHSQNMTDIKSSRV